MACDRLVLRDQFLIFILSSEPENERLISAAACGNEAAVDRSSRGEVCRFVQWTRSLLVQIRQLSFEDIPYNAVVDFGVSMDQDIAKGNDTGGIAELRGKGGIELGELRERLANNGKCSFNSEAQAAKSLPAVKRTMSSAAC
jgi:hypothetical protein